MAQHKLLIDGERTETWEGSHGRMSSSTYDRYKCLCGWKKESYRGFMDDQRELKIRVDFIEHVLKAEGLVV
jgi:hypothetical protein